jgi:hypothetical protein
VWRNPHDTVFKVDFRSQKMPKKTEHGTHRRETVLCQLQFMVGGLWSPASRSVGCSTGCHDGLLW